MSLVQQRFHRHLWVSEGFRDRFGSAKVSQTSLGQRGVQRCLGVGVGVRGRDTFGSTLDSEK